MNHDEIALEIIETWQSSKFLNECQSKANLQVAIVEMLKKTEQRVAGEILSMVQEYAPHKIESLRDDTRESLIFDICDDIKQKYHLEN